MKNWYLVVTDVSDKNVKNWNRMQNAEEFGGILSMSGIRMYAIIMKFDFVRIFLQRVKYWYEICDVLVPIIRVQCKIGTNSC